MGDSGNPPLPRLRTGRSESASINRAVIDHGEAGAGPATHSPAYAFASEEHPQGYFWAILGARRSDDGLSDALWPYARVFACFSPTMAKATWLSGWGADALRYWHRIGY
nr:hypothetical protein Iba_chr15aCG6110 [Ipomoea batatas]